MTHPYPTRCDLDHLERQGVHELARRVWDLERAIGISNIARESLRKERDRYHDLALYLAQEGGNYCEACRGTGLDISFVLNGDQLGGWTDDEIRAQALADEFDGACTEPCDAPTCFEGWDAGKEWR
jgi:hypothetical protein